MGIRDRVVAGETIYKTDWIRIVVVWAIFQSGQLLEGNVLTPKLVGSSVGLHPVWLLLALSVFGSLFGFVGMLVAVPLAAAIGVIVRFGADQYTRSRLFKGIIGRDQE
jgi:predicted PurR-regulated permease PerM